MPHEPDDDTPSPIGMLGEFSPGMLVAIDDQPGWGTGQVQSAIGARVTVNFENAGKRLVDISVVSLRVIASDAG